MSQQIENEKAAVIKNLRACLISTKDGIPVQLLNEDYKQIIGEDIPYRRLGFKALDSFLSTISDITLINKGGKLFIEAKSNESSEHISSFIREQKTAPAKKRNRFNAQGKSVIHIRERKPPRYRRRPAPRSFFQPQRSPPANISVSVSGPSFQPNRIVSVHTDNNNIEEENRNIIKPNSTVKKKSSTHPPLYRMNSDSQTEYRNSSNLDNKMPNSSNFNRKPDFHPPNNVNNKSVGNGTQGSKASNIVKANQSSMVNTNAATADGKNESKISNRLKLTKQKSLDDNSVDSYNDPIQSYESKAPPPLMKQKVNPPPKAKFSVQNRLERVKNFSSTDLKLKVVVDHQQGERSSYFQNELSLYGKKQNWTNEPSYVVYKLKSGKKKLSYASTVRINIPRMSSRLPDEMFECSTFPNDFMSPIEAKENAAKMALEKLKKREQFYDAPILKNPEAVLASVEQSVVKNENGIWAHTFEDEYRLTHNQSLPEYWLDMIKDSPKFEVEELGPSCIIRMKDESFSPDVSELVMPDLPFPAGKTWDVYITGGIAVNDVRLRFIGDEYSTRFDLMTAEMEKWYEVKEHHIQPLLVIGQYYAAYFDNTWLRVIIINVETDKVKVQLIDHGDEEDIPRSLLYRLWPQFYKVPPQVISVSLKGLEEFINRKESGDFFFKAIISRSLVAVVEENNFDNISLTLFDTSKEDAINLNESLRSLFEFDYKSVVPFDIGSVHEMFVMHAEQFDGIIHIQVFSDVLTLLQEHIEAFEDSTLESLKHCCEINSDTVYFVYKNNNYFRVKPQNNIFIDGKVEVCFIDIGTKDHVFLEDICNISDISYLLTQIPGQARPIWLHDIPPCNFTPAMKDMLMDLTTGDQLPSIIGRVRDIRNGIPVVELFRRTEPNNLLISINQTLIIESELSMTGKKVEEMSLRRPSEQKITQVLLTKILNNFPVGSIERIISENRPQLPNINELVKIYVQDVATPSHFLINLQENLASLNKTMDDLNTIYNKRNNIVSTAVEGAICAAKEDNYWYRGYINKVIDKENVSVKLLDYGCLKIIPSCNVKPLLEAFRKQPYAGFCAKIHGISPIHGDWSVEDSMTVKSLINKKTIKAKLKDIIMNESSLGGITLCLQLFTINTDNGLEIDVAEEFVKRSRAKFDCKPNK